MLSSNHAIEILETNTKQWIDEGLAEIPQIGAYPIEQLIRGLHGCNFYSWKADDQSRADCDPAIIVKHKRNLDASNLMRNHFMEAIDHLTTSTLEMDHSHDYSGKMLNSETIGQMLDRISVLTLKRAFVASRLEETATRLAEQQIIRQLHYVTQCYDEFLLNLKKGRAYMLAYKQYKMYKPDE